MAVISLRINGAKHQVDVDPATPLLWVLRDHLGMTGTKYGCGIAQCGACTVHIDGQATRCCTLPVEAVAGRAITTIEGLAESGGQRLQALWVEMNVPQCGYCQSGVLMAAADLLQRDAKPTDADIDASISNICRCGTNQRIRAAIHRAADVG
ncbi:MAG TPA: (2Fe-2S)-binding protein [Halioglobus sp.]